MAFLLQRQAYGGFYVGNLYAHITPYPKELFKFDLIAEEKNKQHIKSMLHLCKDVVFAWGNHGQLPQWLERLLNNPFVLDKIKTAALNILFI